MIRHLTGKAIEVSEKEIILDVSGVGYQIFCPLPTLLSSLKNESKSFFIHTRVREDAINLYGFANQNELFVFEKLIDVSGVGPKSALAMLSVHSPSSIADAVEKADSELLAHTPGIGKKTTEKIILELKGKLSHLQNKDDNNNTFEVRLALEALGYTPREVNEVISKLDKKETNTSKLITEALSKLK